MISVRKPPNSKSVVVPTIVFSGHIEIGNVHIIWLSMT